MNVRKRTLAELPAVYAVGTIDLPGGTHYVAASEGREACLLFAPPDWTVSTVWDVPGGAMNVVPVPGRAGTILAIQGFFPVFDSEGAGIVYATAGADPTRPWRVQRVVDLPFVHRIDVVEVDHVPYVVAATLCGGKTFKDDWSQPGAVYVAAVPRKPDDPWYLEKVLDGIGRNHGMTVAAVEGERAVLVAGREGLFRLRIPDIPGQRWSSVCLIEREISDVALFDLDGDGEPEIVAIEPFHGDRLVVYDLVQGAWRPVSATAVDFGHVVWAGSLFGRPSIIAGSRGGAKDLVLLQPEGCDLEGARRIVLDEGVGPTQVVVREQDEGVHVMSANHGAGEVALYEISHS